MKPKGNPNPSAGRAADDFPGYPHYGKKEDIYQNEEEAQNVDPEMPNRNQPSALPDKDVAPGEFVEGSDNQPGSQESPTGDDEDELDIDDEDDNVDADLTDEDRMALGDTNREPNQRTAHTGSDLDVPGAELDDDMEELGSEDEENNYYSLGGDNHEA